MAWRELAGWRLLAWRWDAGFEISNLKFGIVNAGWKPPRAVWRKRAEWAKQAVAWRRKPRRFEKLLPKLSLALATSAAGCRSLSWVERVGFSGAEWWRNLGERLRWVSCAPVTARETKELPACSNELLPRLAEL